MRLAIVVVLEAFVLVNTKEEKLKRENLEKNAKVLFWNFFSRNFYFSK